MRENESVTRVLIADDSEIASEFLEQLLEADAQIRVIGHAATGRELLEHPSRKLAHVLLVDILMPELGGLSVVRELAGEQRVIVVSSVDADSKVASEAIALGAAAFFSKRHLSQAREATRLRDAEGSLAATTELLRHVAPGQRR